MKIAPITNNNNNITSKGSVNRKIKTLMYGYSETLNHNRILAESYPDVFHYLPYIYTLMAASALKCADIVMDNLETIMSRFGKSCQLTYKASVKNPEKHLFMITSSDSDYVEILDTLELKKENYDSDFEKLIVFTKKLAEINPFEVNQNFRTMRKPELNSFSPRDTFEPEKEIWFIEDELKLNISDNNSKMPSDDRNELRPTVKEVWDELNKFKETFNMDKIMFRS